MDRRDSMPMAAVGRSASAQAATRVNVICAVGAETPRDTRTGSPAFQRIIEKPELDALLAVPDTSMPQGRRERAPLLFLHHTGARASKAAQLKVRAVQLAGISPGQSRVTLRGKGGKTRL